MKAFPKISWDCHESDPWIKTEGALFNSSSEKRSFFLKTLVEEIIPVVTGKNEFEYMNIQINQKCVFFIFPTIGIVMEVSK